jgi:hypothetical protein
MQAKTRLSMFPDQVSVALDKIATLFPVPSDSNNMIKLISCRYFNIKWSSWFDLEYFQPQLIQQRKFFTAQQPEENIFAVKAR